ncbi:Oxidoreductase lepF [Lachnellula suecica]|uniref:Oxidoreductase lepF n=1 Tax=Lachnellula suecica TaxID=602035 RepID=A0A8T9CGM2_9HELO|nr:Oxidoreductase lepF [Lachnellula suecica]
MVKLLSVKQSNAAFAADQSKSSGLTCVFAGATSGIGASTLEVMVSTLHNSTFYILGRSAKKFEAQRQNLEALSPSSQLKFIECNVALISDVDAACKQISAERIDFLYMSQGLVPLNGAEYTSEGLEICFALSYYSRIRLLTNLLPLLRKSPKPRVLSVLNAGKEKAILKDDLGLEDETNWSSMVVVNHTTTNMSLALDFLSEDTSNKSLIVMHAFPGLVRTNIFSKLTAPESSSIFWWFALACIRNIVAVLMAVQGISPQDSGARQVYHLTSDTFTPGSLHLIDESSEEVAPNVVLQGYRDEGMAKKVWDFTMQVFDRVLNRASA